MDSKSYQLMMKKIIYRLKRHWFKGQNYSLLIMTSTTCSFNVRLMALNTLFLRVGQTCIMKK
jgi:hypothetical protein